MQQLTTKITLKDQHGNVVGEKEVATYAGLLAKAHEEGLSAISTRLIQAPSADNGDVAIVEATVTTTKGTFAGIGDASPGNVNRRIVAHLIRMAETRAKARAMRDAVNIGTVALEEMGGEVDEPMSETRGRPQGQTQERARGGTRREEPAPRERPRGDERQGTPPANSAPSAMTDNQHRYLMRALSERGLVGDAATAALCRAAGVRDPRQITKKKASELIDAWKREMEGNRAA